MATTTMVQILDLCSRLDQRAAEIYEAFAAQAGGRALRTFWRKMAAEERDHVELWDKLGKLAEFGLVPSLFDRPAQVLLELDEAWLHVEEYLALHEKEPTEQTAILAAYNLEFSLLHPAFLALAQFYYQTVEDAAPQVDYAKHLAFFTAGAVRHGGAGPELRLLGKTLLRLHRDNALLMEQSQTDPATGLLNRRGVMQMATTMTHLAKRTRSAVAALLVGVDDLKKINAAFGEAAGDRTLKAIALKLRSDLRGSDLVGRYDGSTFLVFLPHVKPASLKEVADMLRKDAMEATKADVPATVSVGGAWAKISEGVESELGEMVRLAESRLRRARRTGDAIELS
jgi:diguanylate cyclase (GGDEF)-like protein